jgi:hypothetical protein
MPGAVLFESADNEDVVEPLFILILSIRRIRKPEVMV